MVVLKIISFQIDVQSYAGNTNVRSSSASLQRSRKSSLAFHRSDLWEKIEIASSVKYCRWALKCGNVFIIILQPVSRMCRRSVILVLKIHSFDFHLHYLALNI